jgi:DNA-directed RNA polymerase subunit RPC12/RpoP
MNNPERLGRCPHCGSKITLNSPDDAMELDYTQEPVKCVHCGEPIYIHFNWSWKGSRKPKKQVKENE